MDIETIGHGNWLVNYRSESDQWSVHNPDDLTSTTTHANLRIRLESFLNENIIPTRLLFRAEVPRQEGTQPMIVLLTQSLSNVSFSPSGKALICDLVSKRFPIGASIEKWTTLLSMGVWLE